MKPADITDPSAGIDPAGIDAEPMQRLIRIMAMLRHPEDGCPWDVEQDFRSIAPYTIEEAYEVAEAIENDDMDALVDELGDLLLQVVFHARMAEEAGHFAFADVAAAVCAKMVRRHPHVFADTVVEGAAAQTRAWEDQKAQERRAAGGAGSEDGTAASAMDGVTVTLPALSRALKLQKRAARVGFDWPSAQGPLAKLDEEIGEIRQEIDAGDKGRLEDEVGDLLFSCVNLARKLDLDPETALRRGNAKFEKRFRRMEAMVRDDGADIGAMPLPQKEEFWVRAKGERS